MKKNSNLNKMFKKFSQNSLSTAQLATLKGGCGCDGEDSGGLIPPPKNPPKGAVASANTLGGQM